jgi:tetratricopeptide (TPR) repeat protein
VQGRFDEVFERVKRSLEIDPLLPIINANYAWLLYLAREYDKAEQQARLTIEIDPKHFSAHWVLGITYGQMRRYDEAFAVLETAINLSGKRPFVVADLGRILPKRKRKKRLALFSNASTKQLKLITSRRLTAPKFISG